MAITATNLDLALSFNTRNKRILVVVAVVVVVV